MYHPKPIRQVDAKTVSSEARRLGFSGPLAVDARWSLLQSLRDRGLNPRFTSVSVLVDKHGVIRWTHGGPRLHPKLGGRYAGAAAAWADLQRFLVSARRAEEDK